MKTFIAAHREPPGELVLDLDATDDPLHGRQEGRFFHGYSATIAICRCTSFVAISLLCAKLRTADHDGAAGAVEEVERIVAQIGGRWPAVRITVRGDSGFAREELMNWCEQHGVDYVLGLARNRRLEARLAPALAAAKAELEASGAPVRRFEELTYQTLESWSRSRRVVGKAEYLPGKANPRFVVTSYAVERLAAAPELFSCFAEPPMGSLKPQKALASGGNSHKHANNRR